MKKLVFTVLALVAFCGVSMANSLDSKVIVIRDCDREGIAARDCAWETSGGKLEWFDCEQIGDCVTEKCIEEVKDEEKSIDDGCR